jgi:hypothetical protein
MPLDVLTALCDSQCVVVFCATASVSLCRTVFFLKIQTENVLCPWVCIFGRRRGPRGPSTRSAWSPGTTRIGRRGPPVQRGSPWSPGRSGAQPAGGAGGVGQQQSPGHTPGPDRALPGSLMDSRKHLGPRIFLLLWRSSSCGCLASTTMISVRSTLDDT